MADIVRVSNLGKKDLRLTFNSQVTTVPAGGEGFIDREAACVHFGDPDKRNNATSPHIEIRDARKNEYDRILALYVSLGEGVSRSDLSLLPEVEVHEVSGEKWTLVYEDPEGKDLPVIGAPEVDKERVLQAMQDQIAKLQQQIDESSQPIAVNEDSPRAPIKKKSPVVMAAHDED